MNINENNEVKLFGFRINNTAAVILIYISLITIIGTIPSLFLWFQELFRYFDLGYSFSELLEIIDEVTTRVLMIINLIIIITISLYILINCTIKQRVFRKNEDIKVRWLAFRLTETSLIVLFILSLIDLIWNLFGLYSSVNSLIVTSKWFVPSYFINYQIISLIVEVFLILVSIYTLIVCIKNRESFR